jgi:hypothetical protein
MPWIHFKEEFRWKPKELNGTWSKTFPADYTGNVPQSCADEAMAAGKAKAVARPAKAVGHEG